MLHSHNHILFCQSNDKGKSYLAVGAENAVIVKDTENAFTRLEEFLNESNDWVFGYLSYDLKNDIEKLSSDNHDGLNFPEMIFFRPELVVGIEGSGHTVHKNAANISASEIEKLVASLNQIPEQGNHQADINIQSRTSKESYLRNAEKILDHIHRGDIYEMNYCHEFYAENVDLEPWTTYQRLNGLTKAPYSCYMKWNDYHIMSGSPELFLERRDNKIYSKPIKGTIRRGVNFNEDEVLKKQLQNDQKERSENIMIVDLVRNDLSKTAKNNSVEVEELCEIYSFETVHQMISTVTSKVEKKTSNMEVLKSTFPMGSMTGAPKIRAMKLIELYEDFKRGIYSGAIGYFEPSGDFTFNVVIRSIAYNSSNRYCSLAAGGALTTLSIPQKEYEETLLKAESMIKALQGNEK